MAALTALTAGTTAFAAVIVTPDNGVRMHRRTTVILPNRRLDIHRSFRRVLPRDEMLVRPRRRTTVIHRDDSGTTVIRKDRD